MSFLKSALMAQTGTPSYVGEPFVDSNGFHLNAPSWLTDGDEMEWRQIMNQNGVWRNKIYASNGQFECKNGDATWVDYKLTEYPLDGDKVLALCNLPSNCLIYNYQLGPLIKTSRICTMDVNHSDSWYFHTILDGVKFKYSLINLSKMGVADKIQSVDMFAKTFYGDDATEDSIGIFEPSLNGTIVVYNGKLFYKS